MTTTAIKERPILFSGPMVRAILDGTKTQTRRVMKPQPVGFKGVEIQLPNSHLPTCPYGQPGDRLWVREAFEIIDDPAAQLPDEPPIEVPPDMGEYKGKPAIRRGPNGERWVVDYKADNNTRIKDRAGTRKWSFPVHMPRWASRITLEVTEVRVQRMQEISEEDAMAQGCDSDTCWDCGGDGKEQMPCGPDDTRCEFCRGAGSTYRHGFARLWDSIHGKKPGHAWADNPWVWAVTFKMVAR